MQQIYRWTPMPKRDFNKVALQLYWNCTSAWVFSCKFTACFRTPFPKNTSGWLFLNVPIFCLNSCGLHRLSLHWSTKWFRHREKWWPWLSEILCMCEWSNQWSHMSNKPVFQWLHLYFWIWWDTLSTYVLCILCFVLYQVFSG